MFLNTRFMDSGQVYLRRIRLPRNFEGRIQIERYHRIDLRDEIAIGNEYIPHQLINAARHLSVSPEKFETHLQVAVGDFVKRGQTLASRRTRRLNADIDAEIIHISDGIIILREDRELTALDSHLKGQVISYTPMDGAVVRTGLALFQGVWGNDRIVTAVFGVAPDGIDGLEYDTINPKYRNEIVVSPYPLTADGVRMAIRRRFSGLVVPSISSQLLPMLKDVPFALMLTEGFGDITFTRDQLEFLRPYEGQTATLDTRRDPTRTFQTELRLARPVTPSASIVPPYIRPRPGMIVRLVTEPNRGQRGSLVDVPINAEQVENGYRLSTVMVKLETGQTVTVPWQNVVVEQVPLNR